MIMPCFKVAKLEAMKEEELLSIDGDIWCQIMYQHDQWIIEDLRASLQDKVIMSHIEIIVNHCYFSHIIVRCSVGLKDTNHLRVTT